MISASFVLLFMQLTGECRYGDYSIGPEVWAHPRIKKINNDTLLCQTFITRKYQKYLGGPVVYIFLLNHFILGEVQ